MEIFLKIARDSKGVTQEQIAKECNIALRSYQYYESGERVPDVHTAQLIAQALNTTVEKLFPLPERQLREKEEKPDGNRASEGTYKI